MLVSHDRALLRETCDEFWLVAHGEVSTFDGDLDDYQRWLQEQAREAALAARAARDAEKQASTATDSAGNDASGGNRREDRKAQAQARQRVAEQAKPLKAELKKVDARMAAATQEQEQLTQSLLDGSLSGTQHAELGKRLKSLGDELEALENRWLELTDAIEQLGANLG